jgi:hypothetical protein
MATKELIYLLGNVGVLLSPPDIKPSAVYDEWHLSLKRADALKTLFPDKYPTRWTEDVAAIDDLQERRPDWRIIFGIQISLDIYLANPKALMRPHDESIARRIELDNG